MEPGSRNTVLTPRRDVAGGRADYLLDVLGGHHAAVVDALAQAGGALYDSDGRFAAVINQQQRVSRRFFDAQRAVLRLWADCDREVAAIVSASGADDGDVPAVFLAPTELPPDDARSWRPAELALRADVESAFLASSIEIEQQLGELLDAWWRSESAERTAVLDDATAWSAAQGRRVGALPPPVVTERSGTTGTTGAISVWPPPATGAAAFVPGCTQRSARELYDELATMMSAPGAVGSIDDVNIAIGRVIDELVGLPTGASLPPPRPVSAPAPAARAHAPAGPDATTDATSGATTEERSRGELRFVDSDEAFDRFWSSPRLDGQARSRPIITDTLVPLVSVVAALTMVLAWIG